MLHPNPFTLSQTLSCFVFVHLQTVFRQIAQEIGALVYSEANLLEEGFASEAIAANLGASKFMLVASASFSALLLSETLNKVVPPTVNHDPPNFQVHLTFEPEAIALFLAQISLLVQPKTILWQGLQQSLTIIQPNNSRIQSEFTLKLLGIFAVESSAKSSCVHADGQLGGYHKLEALTPQELSPESTRMALLQQLEQMRISQAQLYTELQQQKQTLEQQVAERTQALQDMVLAAQSANRAKSGFLASISHEFRTPLTCIIGMSATLQRWSTEVLSDRQQNFLQVIHDSGEHLLSMINDILDLSQAEAGKAVLNPKTFLLSRLAQETLSAMSQQADAAKVDLSLDLQIDPQGDRFIADSRRVRQILVNLLGNAIKFTPQGGKIILRVSSQKNLAIFQVEDTGIGIPALHIPSLFQKFQQLDIGYHRQYGGTGLGLALTKQLVDLHDGVIEVVSTEGVGTTFTVSIPMQRLMQPKSLSTTDDLVLPPAQGRVLLIEHHEETANLICDVLTAAGYQLVWILEGSTAVHQIEAFQPLAVIANTQMPDIDGDRLIRLLRQNPTTQHLKIIVLIPETAIDSFREREFCADEYLPQPVRPDHLLQKLMHLTITRE
ncbi:MAG: response regulator [Leptolyngbyaceae cyanobacterium CRU_2_3]|nr:response regulator [Leptolyngbyaceae cyanobacterium CRU_2_3]